MSDMLFAVGQRWVSNSEAELGLGVIREVSGRRISVYFPAAEETRSYAADNAPLSRVIYNPQDQVSNQQGIRIQIMDRQQVNHCYIYLGQAENGDELTLHEMDLASQVQFRQPQDRLFAGQIDKNSEFDLRLKTLKHHHRLQQSAVFGLLGARVQLLPHQLYIASQVGQRYAPRVLLADEVGLGKTIEAGLILHQQLLNGQAQRALIVVPEALLHQWLVEMLRRFNLSFTLIDQQRFQALTELNEGNPFDSAQLVLSSIEQLSADPAMQQALLASDWDLLIIDEAHHLHWQAEGSSAGYQLAEQLCSQIASVLLLTATPEQLGSASHFARLRLLDPQRYFDLSAFIAEEQQYQTLSQLFQQLQHCQTVEQLREHSALLEQLPHWLDSEQLGKLLQAEAFASQRQQVIADLLDRHGTGRILFRNTRQAIRGFPERRCHAYPLPALTVDMGSVSLEAQLRTELLFDEQWLSADARVSWLVDWLKQHRDDKVLLICASDQTARELELYLRLSHGCRSAVFHQELSLVNRDRAAAYFADDEQGAQILICSEIGSEGRNFQFCHHLILFDLPLNPDLLEQRIGRLDRIGQQQTVQIHVPYHQHSSQQRLFDWYQQALDAFEQVAVAANKVHEQLQDQLLSGLLQTTDAAAWQALLSEAQQLNQRLSEQLRSGRDHLLEQNSFNAEVAADIVQQLEASSRALELADYMDDIFDAFGVEQQTHSTDTIIVEPGNHMLYHDFPGLPEDGLTATYQRHKALSREDMAFLSWEHPMVLGAMDLVLHTELGNTAFCTFSDRRLQTGSLLLEALFTLHSPAPRRLQLGRYQQHSYLRLLVDQQGQDRAALFDSHTVSSQAGRIPKTTAQQLVSHGRPVINQLLKHAYTLAGKHEADWITDAKARMQQQLHNEQQRLQQLAVVNPNIRQQELDYLAQSEQALTEALAQSRLKLDAIRVLIVTEPS